LKKREGKDLLQREGLFLEKNGKIKEANHI